MAIGSPILGPLAANFLEVATRVEASLGIEAPVPGVWRALLRSEQGSDRLSEVPQGVRARGREALAPQPPAARTEEADAGRSRGRSGGQRCRSGGRRGRGGRGARGCLGA